MEAEVVELILSELLEQYLDEKLTEVSEQNDKVYQELHTISQQLAQQNYDSLVADQHITDLQTVSIGILAGFAFAFIISRTIRPGGRKYE